MTTEGQDRGEPAASGQAGEVEARRPNGRFVKGHKLGGRRKGATAKGHQIVREALHEAAKSEHARDEDGNKITKIQALIDRLFQEALDGDMQAAAMILAYYAGRPKAMPDDEDDVNKIAEALHQRLNAGPQSGLLPSSAARHINGESNEVDDGDQGADL